MQMALQGVRALAGDVWIDDATVLIDDGRIVSVDQAPVPQGTVTTQRAG